MKRLHAVLPLAALLSLAACATPPAYNDSAPTALSDEYRYLAAQQAAQASAYRAGDDQLSCKQLELEMIAIATDPAMNAAMASNAANAKAITDSANTAAATMGALSAVSTLNSLPLNVPGLSMLGAAVGQAQGAAMMAQQAEQGRIIDSMMDNMAVMQPGIFRRARVSELAVARDCDFLK